MDTQSQSEQPEEEPGAEGRMTVQKGKEIIFEQGERLVQAGWKPWRDMVESYIELAVDAAKGLADGFEGKKKRGD